MRFRPGRYFAFLAALAAPAALHAQGFGLNEIGSCAVARASATTGAPCEDASALFWNPAYGTRLKGTSIYGGIAAIQVAGDFTADSSGQRYRGNVPTEFPPHVFANWKSASRRYAVGAGVYVPYGLTSAWFDNFPGRFSSLRTSLKTVYVQPNLSFDVTPNWAIGGGPVVGYSKVSLQQSVDLSQQRISATATFASLGIAPGTEFARAQLKGTAMGYGFHVGVHGKIGSSLTIGARYLSSMEFKYDDANARFVQMATNLVVPDSITGAQLGGVPRGTPYDAILAAQFRTGGALVSQKVKTTITHPGQVQVGLGYTAPTGTLISLDYANIFWSKFKELPVNFQGPASGSSRTLIEDYDNSSAVRASIEQKFGLTALRAGFSWVKTPAPDVTVTPLLPDQDRRNYTLGFGFPLSDRFTIDGSYLKVDTEGRRGRIVERPTRGLTAAQLNSGFYRLDANIYSISLKASY
jgi:long-chain fatty acid transport protein